MATAAQTLITNAVSLGYDKLSQRDLLEALLYAVANGGGGGGSGGISSGVGAPVAPPTNTAIDNIYINKTTGGLYAWPAGATGWT